MRGLAVVAIAATVIAGGSCTRNPGTTETTEDPVGARTPSASPAPGRSVEAEVVSTNPTAQMVTVRPTAADQAGSGAVETALPVQGEAAGLLGSLRSGDRVVLTCEAVAEPVPSGGAPARVSPEGLAGGSVVDAGVLGMPCPSVIRIEKVG